VDGARQRVDFRHLVDLETSWQANPLDDMSVPGKTSRPAKPSLFESRHANVGVGVGVATQAVRARVRAIELHVGAVAKIDTAHVPGEVANDADWSRAVLVPHGRETGMAATFHAERFASMARSTASSCASNSCGPWAGSSVSRITIPP
jgi:hypothetical protein